MAAVAVAGPAMNFFLAWVGALLLPAPNAAVDNGLDYLDASIAQHPVVGTFLFYFMLTNLVLGLFNLLPIPPLDGGRIAVGLLPLELARRWARLERDRHPGGDPGRVRAAVSDSRASIRFARRSSTVVPWAINLLLRLSGHDIGGADVHI